ARECGHEVAFLSGPDVHALVDAEEFAFLLCGPTFDTLVADAFARYPETPLATPEDQQRFGLGRLFSEIRVGTTIDDATSIAQAFEPDLVVNEVADFVGPLVAATLDRPNVTLGVGLVLADEWLHLAAAAVAPFWPDAGFEPRADAGCI